MTKNKKVGVISLGCDKNRVDTEKALYILKNAGFALTNEIENAEIILINTCAFLESSRKEAIEEILSASEYKKCGKAEKIIVSGCLPQKFIDEIFDELSEVDAFLGVSDYEQLPEIIERLYKGERVNAVGIPRGECGQNRIRTTENYAYLKIADGCSNHCTYCLIPKIRGKYRSVPTAELIEEVKNLGEIKELILVAQDVTRYGEDLSPKTNLVALLRTLSALPNVFGIRLLYCYPEGVTEELIHEMSVNAKIIRYIDIPLQHADARILKLMNRKGTSEEYLALINKLRERVPGIAIRSTFITGFPTEGEAEFEGLLNFIKEAKLDAAGFFKYSREADTAAYNLDGQLPEKIKSARLRKLYSAQKSVVRAKNKTLVGRTFSVLAEGFDENELCYYGRAYFSAPDVDGKILFFSQEEVEYGSRYSVKIIKASGYDLIGERI